MLCIKSKPLYEKAHYFIILYPGRYTLLDNPFTSLLFFNEDFRILTIQNGLADNKVNCIFRDADGFMWFGTDFGFSIYNGSSFKNFTITDSNNHIESIHQLTPQCIGILTEEELYAFNLEQEEFIPIENIEPHTRISGIHSTNDNTCWLLTDKALFHGRLHIQKTAEGKSSHSGSKLSNGKNYKTLPQEA